MRRVRDGLAGEDVDRWGRLWRTEKALAEMFRGEMCGGELQ